MDVIQHLWFERDMDEAVSLYTSLIPNSEITGGAAVMAESPGGPAGSVRTLSFTLGGQAYRALQAGPLDPFNHAFSIMVQCDTQAEIDRLWDALSEGGVVEQCGWLRDRWGLSWQIVPRRLGELMSDPDPQVVRRVTEQMMQMVKLDIAPLEAAARA
ncbi:VOC family protein [Phenylobacterium sp.]|uniref:VOC family protein n=1 Tax=Phenylobacterium sp. TaxID=1871053 RepID=UPI002FDAB3EF